MAKKSAFWLASAASQLARQFPRVLRGTAAPAVSSAARAGRNWFTATAVPSVQRGAADLGRAAARQAGSARQGITHGLQATQGVIKASPAAIRRAAGLSDSERLLPGLLKYTAGVPQGHKYMEHPIKNTLRMAWSPRYLGLDRPVGAAAGGRFADKTRSAIGAGLRGAGKVSTGLSLPIAAYGLAYNIPRQLAHAAGRNFGESEKNWHLETLSDSNGQRLSSVPNADYVTSVRNKWLGSVLPRALWHQVAPDKSITPLDRVHRDAARLLVRPYIRNQAFATNPIIRLADKIRQVTPLGFAMTAAKRQIASAHEPDYQTAFNQAAKKHLPELLDRPEQVPQSTWYDFYKTLLPEDTYQDTVSRQVRKNTRSAVRQTLPDWLDKVRLPNLGPVKTLQLPRPSDILARIPKPVRDVLPGTNFEQGSLAAVGDAVRIAVLDKELDMRNSYRKLQYSTAPTRFVSEAVPALSAQAVRQALYKPSFWSENRETIRGLTPAVVAKQLDEVLPTADQRWIREAIAQGSAFSDLPVAMSIPATVSIPQLQERLRADPSAPPYRVMTRADMERAGWKADPSIPRDQLSIVWRPDAVDIESSSAPKKQP